MCPSARAATILVVEPHTAVLHLMAEILERSGHTVLAAGGPQEALEWFRTRAQEIRLVILDVYLPRVNGPELAERLLSLRPGLRVLFISEYERGGLIDSHVRACSLPLLTKPFSIRTLTHTVERLLEDRWASAQSVHN